MSKNEHNRPLSNEVKRHFLEIVSTYNKYQEMLERKSDMVEVCENLGGIIEAARELALRESDDWFDKHTIKRNMSELDKLGKQFDKLAVEAKAIDQRLISLYEDMGHILSRYYKFGDISEEEMKQRLAIQESVKNKLKEASKTADGEVPIRIDAKKAEELFDKGKAIYFRTGPGKDLDTADNLNGYTKKAWKAEMMRHSEYRDGFSGLMKWLEKEGIKNPEFYTLKSGKLKNVFAESINEESPALNKKTKKFLDAYLQGTKRNSPNHQFALMHILKGALVDANFHSEAKQLDKFFPKAKMSNYSHEMIDILQDKGVEISNWAKWDGHDIIDALAYYTQMTIGGQFGEKLKSLKESINEKYTGNPGDKLTHKYNKDISIELIDTTNRGWKVYQYEKKGNRVKKKTAYYDSQDISGPKSLFESINESISVFDERHFGKNGIIIMIDDNGKKVSAIFKNKKNADKYNRNNPSDVKKLLDLAKKTPYPKAIDEAAHGYKDSTSGYISNHNDEYKMAEKINKSVKGDEMKFYDELEKLHQKLKHAKYMIWLSNALRGYKVDMYKDPKIKNKAEAEEALYLLSK